MTFVIYLVCEDTRLISPTEDISKKCSTFATIKYCKNNAYVLKRCQKSCGVCVGGKYKKSSNEHTLLNHLKNRGINILKHQKLFCILLKYMC